MKKDNKGRFISFEGIDGSGKSSLAKKVAHYLESRSIPCYLTAEPTQSKIGTMIREIVLKENSNSHDALMGLFLFSADRCSHIKEIKVLLDQGYWVLCDRYLDSTYAYQAIDEKMLNLVYTINGVMMNLLRPELTFLLDLPPELSLLRLEGRERDCFEQLDLLTGVRKRYLHLAAKEKDRIVLIDGRQSPEEVEREAVRSIDNVIHLYTGE